MDDGRAIPTSGCLELVDQQAPDTAALQLRREEQPRRARADDQDLRTGTVRGGGHGGLRLVDRWIRLLSGSRESKPLEVRLAKGGARQRAPPAGADGGGGRPDRALAGGR